MFSRRYFIRNLEGPDLFLTFLISAAGAILSIRLYLHLAGFPQLGGRGLHIAHMLWGGLFMLIALVILLGFLNQGAERLGAVLGGIGWGTFIDELGKFITQDNDYFFQPTVALIYVSFVVLYIAFQLITRYATLSDDEYEANAMRVIEDAVVRGLTVDRVARVQEYLARCRSSDPVATAIGSLLKTAIASPAPPPSPFQHLHAWGAERYADLAEHPYFRTALVIFFAVHALLSVGNALLLADTALSRFNVDIPFMWLEHRTFAELGTLISSTFSGLFVIAGVIVMRRSRMRAYRLFKAAVVISILLTEFFVFLDVQFQAISGFALNVVILLALNTLIGHERELRTAVLSRAEVKAPPEHRGSITYPAGQR